MLYLSRMDPSRDPKKTRSETYEESKRFSLAQQGVKEGEDIVAEEEVRFVREYGICVMVACAFLALLNGSYTYV